MDCCFCVSSLLMRLCFFSVFFPNWDYVFVFFIIEDWCFCVFTSSMIMFLFFSIGNCN
jgi:hypothetical protein